MKQSFSFRLGQLLTWPARKARTFVRCWRENGFRYTMRVYFLDRKKDATGLPAAKEREK